MQIHYLDISSLLFLLSVFDNATKAIVTPHSTRDLTLLSTNSLASCFSILMKNNKIIFNKQTLTSAKDLIKMTTLKNTLFN